MFIPRYTQRSMDGTAISSLKFHTTYICAYALGQSELPIPPPGMNWAPGELTVSETGEVRVGILGGKLGRAIRSVMARGRSGNWPAIRCAYDIMMSKVGMPAAPRSFIDATYIAHQKALTQKVDEYRSMYDTFVLNRVKEQIEKIIKKVFGRAVFVHKDPLPSLRASCESSIRDAGALGKLFRSYREDAKHSLMDTIEPDQLFSMTVDRDGTVSEVRFPDVDDLVTDFQDYIDSIVTDRLSDPLVAHPVPICEPLKVRMITKGQAAEYYRTIELQKFMHGRLKRHPVFEYIGHPIDEESWAKCFGSLSALPQGSFYVSGDYKAATDNLNPELSLFTWDCICKYSTVASAGYASLKDTYYADLGRKALCGHQLVYPEIKGCEQTVAQTWGQLMGSPMSFPILCVVNAAATLTSIGQEFSKDNSLKVNGDDVAFIANDETYATWKQVTKICGLEFSQGKNYISRSFIIMNSELRRPPLDPTTTVLRPSCSEGPPDEDGLGPPEADALVEIPSPWKLEAFLNQSILYRTIKKGSDAGKIKDIYWTDLQSLSHEAINGMPGRDQWKIMKIFLRSHASIIAELPPYCNKWFPTALGGAGMAIPEGKTIHDLCSTYTSERLLGQRKQAAYLACYDRKRLKRIQRTSPVVGEIGDSLREIISMSNAQAPARLVPKPLNREQHTMLGGKTLLGLLLKGFWSGRERRPEDPPIHKKITSVGGELRSEVLLPPSNGVSLHTKETRYLNNKYQNWLRAASKTSLDPMDLDKIVSFQEHLALVSVLELLLERPTGRLVDHLGVCPLSHDLVEPEMDISQFFEGFPSPVAVPCSNAVAFEYEPAFGLDPLGGHRPLREIVVEVEYDPRFPGEHWEPTTERRLICT